MRNKRISPNNQIPAHKIQETEKYVSSKKKKYIAVPRGNFQASNFNQLFILTYSKKKTVLFLDQIDQFSPSTYLYSMNDQFMLNVSANCKIEKIKSSATKIS